jgi:hypothetical protein
MTTLSKCNVARHLSHLTLYYYANLTNHETSLATTIGP